MLKLLKRFNKKQIGYVLICFLFVIIQVFLDLKVPDYMSDITKLVQTEGSSMRRHSITRFIHGFMLNW